MSPDEEYRERLGKGLTKRLADAISKGEIDEKEAPLAASYLLENTDKAKNSAELLDFLEKIVEKWPIFDQVLTLELGKKKGKEEKETVEVAENLIKENKIDEALKVTEGATEGGDQ